MAIIVCPSCRQPLSIPDAAPPGQMFRCPKCPGQVQVPAVWPPSPPPLPTAAAMPPTLPSHAPLIPTPQTAVPEFKGCPFCGEQVLQVAKKCKHCGETIDVALRAAEEARRAAQRQPSQPNVFMNAGGGSASSSSSAASGGGKRLSRSLYYCPRCENDIHPVWLFFHPSTCPNCGKWKPFWGWPKH
jgi:LSD1 subclass zinc finger protein